MYIFRKCGTKFIYMLLFIILFILHPDYSFPSIFTSRSQPTTSSLPQTPTPLLFSFTKTAGIPGISSKCGKSSLVRLSTSPPLKTE